MIKIKTLFLRKEQYQLSFRLLLYVVLCSSFFTLLATSSQLYFDYHEDINSIHSDIKFIEESYLETISANLYIFDYTQLETLLHGMLRIKNVEYIHVEDTSTDFKDQEISVGKKKSNRFITKKFPLNYQVESNKQTQLGNLTVVIGLDGVYRHLVEKVFIVLLSNAAKTFLASMVILLIFQYMITRHLQTMVDYANHLDPEYLDQPLTLHRKKKHTRPRDEFDTLIDSINEMRIRIRTGIQALKQKEYALRKSDEQYRTTLDSMDDSIYVVDRDFKIILVNTAFKNFNKSLGLDHNVTGKSLDGIYPFYTGKTKKEYQSVLNSGESAISEHTLSIRGRRLIIETRKIPIFEKNSVAKIITISRDITEQKLANERIERNEKMKSIGELSTGIAHEINNPNNFILLNSTILQKAWESITPVLEHYLETDGDFAISGMSYEENRHRFKTLFSGIIEGSERIEKIISSLKDYAFPEPASQRESTNIESVMNSALILLANKVKDHCIHFKSKCQNTPLVMGNFQRLEQVFINLILNACEALTDSTQTITITIECDEPRQQVIISLVDEGKGIAPSDLGNVRHPFFTTKREYGGSGLGLYICTGIVEAHQGSLEIESEPERGTTVRVLLPTLADEKI